MKKFQVTLKEVYFRILTVEAEDDSNALDITSNGADGCDELLFEYSHTLDFNDDSVKEIS